MPPHGGPHRGPGGPHGPHGPHGSHGPFRGPRGGHRPPPPPPPPHFGGPHRRHTGCFGVIATIIAISAVTIGRHLS